MDAMRYWRRFANPVRRLAVTWRYQGSGAVVELARQRVREVRPAADAAHDADAWARIAAQAVTLPATPRSLPQGAPTVTVIVRTHDRPALLTQALTSLANQTFTDFEVVLVNDGRADVADVAAQLAPYLLIRQAEHAPGSGRTVALNAGLATARGRWITYLDDDDIVYPEHLERLLGALADGQALAAYADALRVLCWSDQQRDEVVIRMPCASLDFDRRRLLVDNWIASVAFMHAAACAARVGPFDPALEPFEDWDYLLRLSDACSFTHVAEMTYEYRSRFGPIPEHTQSVLRQRERVLEATRRIYARHPTPPGELHARRQLTLAALEQDIAEVREIERTVADPVQRDLLISARVGRFPVSRTMRQQYRADGRS